MILDANACLRYLLDDLPDQAERVRREVERGEASTIPEVLCECVYVLAGKTYGIDRTEVASALEDFLDDVACERKPIMVAALRLFGATRLDFVDCILIETELLGGGPVLTFDKKMRKQLERLEVRRA